MKGKPERPATVFLDPTDFQSEIILAAKNPNALNSVPYIAEDIVKELVEAIKEFGAKRAYAVGLGVSEWKAFLSDDVMTALANLETAQSTKRSS